MRTAVARSGRPPPACASAGAASTPSAETIARTRVAAAVRAISEPYANDPPYRARERLPSRHRLPRRRGPDVAGAWPTHARSRAHLPRDRRASGRQLPGAPEAAAARPRRREDRQAAHDAARLHAGRRRHARRRLEGGYPHNPGWLHNLRAHPDTEVQIGRRRTAVHAREAT